MQNYRKGAHTLYDLKYHIVWVTKYRKPILTTKRALRTRELIREIAQSKNVQILKGHVSKDHIQFKAVFLGKVYNLSSAEAREKFEKNPKLYAPAAGGLDVVMSHKDGTEVEGMLDHAAWFRDRLYLFSNAKTKSDFEATPTQFVIE